MNPPNILDNSDKLIRKKILTESQGSNIPMPRANSFPESFVTIENIQFYVPIELSLFRTKSESFQPKLSLMSRF